MSAKPRCDMVCAATGATLARSTVAASAVRVGRRAITLLPANCLQREALFLESDVVFELVERQPGAAAAAQIHHLELLRRPDPLDVLDVRIGQAAYDLVLDQAFNPRERVVVLANPDDRLRVLGALCLTRRRLDLP